MSPDGDHHAEPDTDALFQEAYDHLRNIAAAHFRRQPGSHTLQPTALVHEAWLRLAASSTADPSDAEHLLALASRAMRHALVDHARIRNAEKRGGGPNAHWARITLSDVQANATAFDVLALNEAIEELQKLDPRQASIVELRFFGGLTVDQTATVLGVSPRTVSLDWEMARGWLWDRLQPETNA